MLTQYITNWQSTSLDLSQIRHPKPKKVGILIHSQTFPQGPRRAMAENEKKNTHTKKGGEETKIQKAEEGSGIREDLPSFGGKGGCKAVHDVSN